MLARFALTNATIITPDRLIEGGTVLVEEGRIADVVDRGYPAAHGMLDVGGRFVLPGLVDLHNDALEREINPRPGANFDPTFALLNLDRKLAAAGVTTQFHAISFAERSSSERSLDYAADLCQTVHALRAAPHAAIENQVLHRLDLRTVGALDRLLDSLDEASIPLISLNDHVPGQGQYRDIATFRKQIRPYLNKEVSEADLDALVQQRLDRAAATEVIVEETLRRLIGARARRPLILVSHDDDTVERVEMMHELGCIVSEFPITIEAAQRSHDLGLRNAMGAPNALRGGSLTGNASALDLMARGLVDILVADYHAPALLAAVFLIVARGLADLPAAVRLVTAAPAAAVGLEDRGAIEVGRRADLVALTPDLTAEATWIEGTQVYG